MPDNPNRELQEGVRLERGGLLDKALAQLGAAARVAEPAVLAEALRHQADIHRVRCDWDRALELADRSEAIAASAGRPDLVAEALNARAAVHLERREFGAAEPLLRRMLELTIDPRIHGIALQNLGVIAAEQGRYDDARARFTESHLRFNQAEYLRGMATSMINSGRIALLEDDHEAAEEQCRMGERLARRLGDLELAAMAALNLAEALLRRGRLDPAEAQIVSALGYFSRTGNTYRQAEAYRILGDLHTAAGDPAEAEACYRQGLRLARESDTPLEATRLEERLKAVTALPGEPGGGA